MIKFFRKIRQQLLSENKFSKYLIYAIGEILLVVIGILLALNINNKNQQKINDTKIINVLKEIQADLEKDINRSASIFDDYIKVDSVQELILTKKYTVEDFKAGRAITLGTNYYDFIIHTNGYDNLIRNLDNLPEKYKPLLADLNYLYDIRKTYIDVGNTRIRKTVYDNLTYMSNQPWALDWNYGMLNNEGIEYFLNDPHYKGYLINYMNDRRTVFANSNQYKINAVKTYKKIAMMLPNNDSIPKTITLKNKDNINENKLIGTYRIRDSLGQGFAKKYKVSQLKNQLYVKLDDRGKYKLNWHKEFIYFGANGKVICDFNKSDTLIIRLDLRNAIFVRDNSNPQ